MPGTTHSFSFNNDPAAVYPLVTEITSFVQSERKVPEGSVIKLKAVLVEMLTNAVKHSGGLPIWLEVTLADDDIIITKTDTGEPFSLVTNGTFLRWPLPGNHQGGRVITLYGDDSCQVKGKLANNCTINFFIEETSESGITFEPDHLPEHFGMMIIARACYRFTYTFDIDSCTNVFTAAMRLK